MLNNIWIVQFRYVLIRQAKEKYRKWKVKNDNGLEQTSYRVIKQHLRPFYTWILADLKGIVLGFGSRTVWKSTHVIPFNAWVFRLVKHLRMIS